MQAVNTIVPRREMMQSVFVKKDMFWKKTVNLAKKFIPVTLKIRVVVNISASKMGTSSLVNAIEDSY